MGNGEATSDGAVYPVVLSVPLEDRLLKGREGVAALSRHARRALAVSAGKSGVTLSHLPKDDDGVPQPVAGNYWSLTHKAGYVGGVVSPERIGIDIEKMRPCSPGLFRKTAHEEEWALSGDDPQRLFFRYWTAKESVLKASGTGVKDLLRCRIIALPDDTHLAVDYRDETWRIEHIFFDGHIASVTQGSLATQWVRL